MIQIKGKSNEREDTQKQRRSRKQNTGSLINLPNMLLCKINERNKRDKAQILGMYNETITDATENRSEKVRTCQKMF